MVFSSLIFLLLFLPATLAGYALLRKLFPKTLLPVNLLLCLFSLLFYRWGAGWAEVALLLALTAVNYLAAYVRRQTGSRLPLVLGVAFDCAVLLRFKYPALVLTALQAAPASGAGLEGAVIPLGLSFTVFHAISFLVDEAHDEDNLSASAPPRRTFLSPVSVALYLLFFPKLAQGPIVRWRDMAPALEDRPFTLDGVCAGAERFILGLGKKVLLADAFGAAVSQMGSAPMDGPSAWLMVLFFSLQIYLDFSGYSDMALGLGRMFGFSFRENFSFPYLSTSVGEFWRRWHISLGAWFRQYVYIPLGGSRRGSVYANLLIVFLLTGMWHGSTAIYLCWGLAHGLCVMAERTVLFRRVRDALPRASFFGWVCTMLVVGIGWQCFRLQYVSDFLVFLKSLAGIPSGPLSYTWQFYLTPKLMVLTALSVGGIWLFSRPSLRGRLRRWNENSLWFQGVKYASLLALSVLCFCAVVANGYTPFLYFQY